MFTNQQNAQYVIWRLDWLKFDESPPTADTTVRKALVLPSTTTTSRRCQLLDLSWADKLNVCLVNTIHLQLLSVSAVRGIPSGFWIMLDKIKQWTLRVLDLAGGGTEPDPTTEDGPQCREDVLGLESALRSLQECRLDPRELPRPHRDRSLDNSGSDNRSSEDSEEDVAAPCRCRNCFTLLSELQECAICLEPLSQITSCSECGNMACRNCAVRLPRCPYCRANPGLVPNPAIQRLLYKMDIPCTNSILPIRCPHKKCKWRGEIDGLASHLEHTHLITILDGSSVTLDIAEFQRKAELSETRQRHYSVLLACYSDVFVCKVALLNNKLKVGLSQLTGKKAGRLGAWVEISCSAKTMKGIIPLSKTKSDIEVPVANFLSPTKGHADRVSISINIRPMS